MFGLPNITSVWHRSFYIVMSQLSAQIKTCVVGIDVNVAEY